MNETDSAEISVPSGRFATTQHANNGAQAPAPADSTPTVAASTPPPVDPDPLLTPDIELDEEEKAWRSNPSENFRLNRKHKPPATRERIAELEARVKEVQDLFDALDHARKGKDETKAKELEELIPRRMLKPYDQVVLRLYWVNGLLTEQDRENLRAAEKRRAKKNARRLRLGATDAFDANRKSIFVRLDSNKLDELAKSDIMFEGEDARGLRMLEEASRPLSV